MQLRPDVRLPLLTNRGEIASEGLDRVVDIENVLGALVASAFVVDQNLLDEECRRVGNEVRRTLGVG